MKKDPVGDTAGLVHFHLQLLGFLLEFGHLLLGLGAGLVLHLPSGRLSSRFDFIGNE